MRGLTSFMKWHIHVYATTQEFEEKNDGSKPLTKKKQGKEKKMNGNKQYHMSCLHITTHGDYNKRRPLYPPPPTHTHTSPSPLRHYPPPFPHTQSYWFTMDVEKDRGPLNKDTFLNTHIWSTCQHTPLRSSTRLQSFAVVVEKIVELVFPVHNIACFPHVKLGFPFFFHGWHVTYKREKRTNALFHQSNQ